MTTPIEHDERRASETAPHESSSPSDWLRGDVVDSSSTTAFVY
jgi:hypothetical protein